MKNRFLVIGLGRFGLSLAETLADLRCEVCAVDLDMHSVAAVKDRVAYCAQLDATDPEALRSVDAGRCSIAVVAIGENFEAAVLSVAALKELGVARIVARAQTRAHARILSAVGATEVLELEAEMGRRLGQGLAASGGEAAAVGARLARA